MQRKTDRFLFNIACLVSLGGILYGYDMGVISGALLFIRNTIPMTDTQVGVIVGAVLGGGLLGTLLAGPLGDRFGRRALIGNAAAIFIFGVLMILVAHTFIVILCARLLLGVGVGMVSVAVPLYVAEIVPSKNRGKFITFFQLLLTFGIVLAYFVDLIFTPTGNWRGMFAVLLIPSVFLLLGITVLPESPRWLLAQGREAEARKVLSRVRHHASDVDDDITMMLASLHVTYGSWREFMMQARPCLLAVSVAIFNQLTGINSFLQYAPLILKNAGISSNLVSMLGSVGIGGINFIFTIVAIALIDAVGRRPLLLVGVVGVMLSEIYLGCVSLFMADSSYAGMLALIGLLVYIAFFAVGPGVVVWLAISELFPTRVRGKGIAICLFFSSLAATTLSVFFLPLIKTLGIGQTYWLFAGFTTLYAWTVWRYLPETKARSLEEIQMDLRAGRKLLVTE